MSGMIINPYAFGPSYTPASYVFNGTDELMTRTFSTSAPNTTIFTVSFWMKTTDTDGHSIFLSHTGTTFTQVLYFNDESFNARDTIASVAAWDEGTAGGVLNLDNTWHHFVARYDSTQGTADNRLILYKDGSVVNDTNFTAIGASEVHHMFTNGNVWQLGNYSLGFDSKKMAFIDVLEGVSQAASAFAFDNGGTWTRKLYAGSYGTYGFKLDGTNLFADVSGNGQNFTGTNMDATNLDTADLPPYTN
jgi:hypothetical protein